IFPSQLPPSAVPSGPLIGRSGSADVPPPCPYKGASAGSADDQRPKGEKPSPPPLVVIAAPSRSNKQPDFNIKGPLLTTYMKRLSIGLFSERLNWANNLQNPIIRERFPLLSVNRGRGN